MNSLRKRLAASPLAARVVPFVVFAAFTVGQGKFGESSRFWIYFVKTIVGAWLIWLVRPLVSEMKWKFSWAAVVVGIDPAGNRLDDEMPRWTGLSGKDLEDLIDYLQFLSRGHLPRAPAPERM